MATRKQESKTPASADDSDDGSTKVRDAHGGGDLPDADSPDRNTKGSGDQRTGKPSRDPKWNREHDSSRNGRGYGPDGSMSGEEPEVVTKPGTQRPPKD